MHCCQRIVHRRTHVTRSASLSLRLCVCDLCRDGAEMVLPADLHTTNLVLREAQFFQLSGLIELLQAHKRRFEQVSGALPATVHAHTFMKERKAGP